MSFAISYRLIQKDLSNKLTFEERPEGNEENSHADIWGKSLPGT